MRIVRMIGKALLIVLIVFLIGGVGFWAVVLYNIMEPTMAGEVNILPDDPAFIPHAATVGQTTFVYLSEPKNGIYRIADGDVEFVFEIKAWATLRNEGQHLMVYGLHATYDFDPETETYKEIDKPDDSPCFKGSYSRFTEYEDFSFSPPFEMDEDEFVSFSHKAPTETYYIVSNTATAPMMRYCNDNLIKYWRYDRLVTEAGDTIYQTGEKDRILCCWDASFVLLNYRKWELDIYDYDLKLLETVPLHCRKHWSKLNCEVCDDTLFVFEKEFAGLAATVKLDV